MEETKKILGGRNSCCLYLWEISDEMGLLNSICQEFNDDNSHDSADLSSQSYSCQQRKRKHSGSNKSMSYTEDITTDLMNATNRELIRSNEISIKQLDASVELNKSYQTNNTINYINLINTTQKLLYDYEDERDDSEPGSVQYVKCDNRCKLMLEKISSYKEDLNKIS